jgi:hypothetical protein
MARHAAGFCGEITKTEAVCALHINISETKSSEVLD